MFIPNGILALSILAATPPASTHQAAPAGRTTQEQARAHYEDASVIPAIEHGTLASEKWDSAAGTASASDSSHAVAYASLDDAGPLPGEPLPVPPGDAPPIEPPGSADLEPVLPPDSADLEPAPPPEEWLDGETIGPGLLLDEPLWEDEALEFYEEGCEWEGCGGYQCSSECGTCQGEGGRWPGLLAGVDFDGWISQGVTINTDSPADRSNFPVTFNDRSNDYQMNQVYLMLGKAVERGCCWDVGGRVDLLYGTDSVYTVARGLETRGDFSPRWNAQSYGLSLPQAYLEVYAPIGRGLTMKLGHFYTILGYESVPAVDNFFYSKSLAMQYGEPFTHTGFLGTTRLGTLDLHAGMTRGWDNWEDNNNDFAFLGGLSWNSPDEGTSIAFAVHVGREQDEPPLNTNVRTVYSLVVQQWLSQRLLYAAQYDHGFDERGAPRGQDADWFGINQYFYYTINCRWRAALRCEWFRDEDAARVDHQAGADYFELSMGLNWMPTSWITARPELRWDWASPLHGGSLDPEHRDDQILLALDVVVRL